MKEIKLPKDKGVVGKLKAGEYVLFSGIFYTARDQAHQKIVDRIKNRKKIPFDLRGKVIYYCGPTEASKGKVIGSCGPTTSSRMDSFVQPLLERGLFAMVGKGRRSEHVKKLIKKYRSIYFLAPAGCGALLAKSVVSRKTICFANLGPEAVSELKVEKFPLVVGIDSRGESVY